MLGIYANVITRVHTIIERVLAKQAAPITVKALKQWCDNYCLRINCLVPHITSHLTNHYVSVHILHYLLSICKFIAEQNFE